MKKSLPKLKLVAILISRLFALLLSSCNIIPKKNLHGTKLLKLSDDQLFETVYFQHPNLIESFPDVKTALSQIRSASHYFCFLSCSSFPGLLTLSSIKDSEEKVIAFSIEPRLAAHNWRFLPDPNTGYKSER